MFFITCPACKSTNLNTNFFKKKIEHDHDLISYKEYKLTSTLSCKNCNEKIGLINHIRTKDEKIIWINFEIQKQDKLEKIKFLKLEIDRLINIKRSETNKRKIKYNLQKRITRLEDEIQNQEYKMKASISVKTKITSLYKANYF